MERMVKEFEYTSVKQFLTDINQVSFIFLYECEIYSLFRAGKKYIFQIFLNSETYNGPPEKSMYTSKALEIKDMAKALIEEKKDQFVELERNMNRGEGDYDDDEGDMRYRQYNILVIQWIIH